MRLSEEEVGIRIGSDMGVGMLGQGQHKWRERIREPRKEARSDIFTTDGGNSGGRGTGCLCSWELYVSNLELNKWPVEASPPYKSLAVSFSLADKLGRFVTWYLMDYY